MKISYSFEQEKEEFVEETKSVTAAITTVIDKIVGLGKELITAKLADRSASRAVEQSIQIEQLTRTVELLSKKLDRLESQPKDIYKK